MRCAKALLNAPSIDTATGTYWYLNVDTSGLRSLRSTSPGVAVTRLAVLVANNTRFSIPSSPPTASIGLTKVLITCPMFRVIGDPWLVSNRGAYVHGIGCRFGCCGSVLTSTGIGRHCKSCTKAGLTRTPYRKSCSVSPRSSATIGVKPSCCSTCSLKRTPSIAHNTAPPRMIYWSITKRSASLNAVCGLITSTAL